MRLRKNNVGYESPHSNPSNAVLISKLTFFEGNLNHSNPLSETVLFIVRYKILEKSVLLKQISHLNNELFVYLELYGYPPLPGFLKKGLSDIFETFRTAMP
jgi:hypothetical protein